MRPRYPHVFVSVSDGKPITEIIERAETAMKRAGISTAERREFRACVPDQCQCVHCGLRGTGIKAAIEDSDDQAEDC
jgi:hypothetical protein